MYHGRQLRCFLFIYFDGGNLCYSHKQRDEEQESQRQKMVLPSVVQQSWQPFHRRMRW